jgi:UDP-N-acetyl-D-mannosaminuronate dehydrogenase
LKIEHRGLKGVSVRAPELDVPLTERMKDRTAVVAVIGLGYVGLPMAIELGKAGFEVIGVDVSSEKVTTIEVGKSDVGDVPDFEVAGLKSVGKLRATTDYSDLADADVIIICVAAAASKDPRPRSPTLVVNAG